MTHSRFHYNNAQVRSWDSEGNPVTIAVSLMPGLPRLEFARPVAVGFHTIRDRLRVAFRTSDLLWPTCRMVADFTGSHLIQGRRYDLPLALAILLASGQIEAMNGMEVAALGELHLDGSLVLNEPFEMSWFAAVSGGSARVFAPVRGPGIESVAEIRSVVPYFRDKKDVKKLHALRARQWTLLEAREEKEEPPLQRSWNHLRIDGLQGQDEAHRGLQLALTGSHDIFLEGSPGCGKSALILAYAALFPELCFRNPKASITLRQFIGGGSRRITGEIRKANQGILYLEELYHYSREVLEHLGQILDQRQVQHEFRGQTETHTVDFILMATANPCPCGRAFEDDGSCECALYRIRQYRQRVRPSFIDRLSIHIPMRNLPSQDLPKILEPRAEYEPETVREKILEARDRQSSRCKRLRLESKPNGRLPKNAFAIEAIMPRKVSQAAAVIAKHYQLSARSYLNLLRVCRSIADLEGNERVATDHLMEATLYLPQKKGQVV